MKRKLSAREAAAKICSLSHQTRKTLSEKLYKKGYARDELENAVEAMYSLRYIDEENYAKSFVNDSYKIKKHGKIRIMAELKLKGIQEDVIESAIENAGADEFEILKTEYEKRFSGKEDKNKILRYFVSRGFNLSDIRRCMDEE